MPETPTLYSVINENLKLKASVRVPNLLVLDKSTKEG